MFSRLLVLFITIPLIELVLFLTVGDWIGIPATVGVVIVTGILGAWLTKSQGLRTLQRYRQTWSEGRVPHQEVLEGLLILVAGAVLLTPGFLTDAVGFLLLIPATRAIAAGWLRGILKDRIKLVVPGRTEGPDSPDAGDNPRVVDVEVVED